MKTLLLEIAGERSLDHLLGMIVSRVAAMSHMALCRIWLIEDGDICDVCHLRDECPDKTHCLHLVASAGQSVVDTSLKWDGLDGQFRRFPIGVRKVGHVAATGDAVVVWDLAKDMKWAALKRKFPFSTTTLYMEWFLIRD